MTYEVLWSEVAVRDLERIVDFLEAESPSAADAFFTGMAERALSLETMPQRGRLVPEFAHFDISTYRELIVRPYRLVYRVDAARVLVVAVFDGRRNLEDVLLSRLVEP
jgi:toxin ParE1/3/4